MGSLRNQVGALVEILKSSEHSASVAILPSTAAAGLGASERTKEATATPFLDQLGPLEGFGSLKSATLPQAGYHLVAKS